MSKQTSQKQQAAIVPHTETKGKGIDICCGYNASVYIIRSDLHCYMKCGVNLDYEPGYSNQAYQILPLHPACSGGDHYVISEDGYNIIKGDYFITVWDLSTPRDKAVQKQKLSDLCKGGDNYLAVDDEDGKKRKFIIIKGTEYVAVSDLTSTTFTQKGALYSDYINGLYYFGWGKSMFVVTQNDLGVMFSTTDDPGDAGANWFVYPNVIDFLPGGLSVSIGVSTPKWVILKSITNNSKSAKLTWKDTITKTLGYNKSHFSSLEKAWSVNTELNMGTSFEAGFLVQSTIEVQFSLGASYGGTSVRTSQEDWNEAHTTTEDISLTIEPGESVYIWQFRMGFKGSQDILFCRDLQVTNSPNAPTSIPLPPV